MLFCENEFIDYPNRGATSTKTGHQVALSIVVIVHYAAPPSARWLRAPPKPPASHVNDLPTVIFCITLSTHAFRPCPSVLL